MIGILLSSKKDIETIPTKTPVAIIRFRPSIKLMVAIRRQGVRTLVIPKSINDHVSDDMKDYASQMGLKVIVSKIDGRGRRSDIHGNLVELDKNYNIKSE